MIGVTKITFILATYRQFTNGTLLRMYCVDTDALVFMFNRGNSYGFKTECTGKRTYTLSSVTGSDHVKYMASPFFYFYMTTCQVL